MKKEFGEYYLGLDVGTGSVGWAATDMDYKLLTLNGKQMWGVHLFEDGHTAQERRAYRAGRRRNDRKQQRLALLRELFAEEITKVDPGFYQRLQDSRFVQEDKSVHQPNTLFFDPDFRDKDYHRLYPTIYHLRLALMEDREERHDIRLLYLAIAHILKKRGHFLLQGQEFEIGAAFAETYERFLSAVNELLPEPLSLKDSSALERALMEAAPRAEKKEKLMALFGVQKKDKQAAAILGLLVGYVTNLDVLFDDPALKEEKALKVDFTSAKYEELLPEYEAKLGDRIECLGAIKALYDWSALAGIMKGQKSISAAQVQSYDKHRVDLRKLKAIVKKHCGQAAYRELFHDEKQKDNYIAYIGKGSSSNNTSTCRRDDFYSRVKKLLASAAGAPEVGEILADIERGTFLPRQSSGDNGVIPYQLHLAELKQILCNAEKHFPFLTQKDSDGRTVSEKIISIMAFRIPYYVGPLNTAHAKPGRDGFSWMVRKESGPIRPWNFEEKVDLDASGEQFIRRMTNTCTYLIGEDVLPRDSLLYRSYDLLNHINCLRIDGVLLPVPVKQALYENLRWKSTIRIKDIGYFLKSAGVLQGEAELTGIDEAVKLSMKPWADFRKIFGSEDWDRRLAEDCIRTIVLFGQEKAAVRRRIKAICAGRLSEEQVKKISALNYSEWGRFSRKFLMETYSADKATGEAVSIIRALYETNDNLEQLLSARYDFGKAVEQWNAQVQGGVTEFSYDALVEPLYCSPAVKRGIWRALNIVKEVEKVTGHPPKKIFVEMARGEEETKKRTVSRRKELQSLYSHCKEEQRDWVAELENLSDEDLRRDRLYLYYTQMGRCMYSGEPIELSELFNNSLYDIDHIYPQSKTKDDSLNNRVLVKKQLNQVKQDIYPIPATYRENALPLWKMLLSKGLISKEKFFRLTRQEDFTAEELAGFINRQLVETRQSTKAIAQALQTLYGEIVVFVKAGNVSDFRKKNNFVKLRDLNDYHHAKDAYLNIVVGNVYDTKFTRNPANFIRNARPGSYSLNRMYDYDVSRGDTVAWRKGDSGSIATVKATMAGNRILFTRYAHEATGEFYDQMPLKKGKGQIPLKSSDPRLANIDRYGGYTKDSSAYFFLVEHMQKKKRVRSLEYAPIRYAAKFAADPGALQAYCEQELGLAAPKVLISKIKIDSLFRIDGFPMHLSGRTGNSVTFKPAAQLVLPPESERYLKRVCKFVERKKANAALRVISADQITLEENLALYDLLIQKHRDTIYAKRPASQLETLVKGRDTFAKLSLEEQCAALANILVLFRCVFARTDLRAIGGSGQAGTVTKNKNLTGCSQALLIHQSVTGLFEQRIDLLKL